MTTSFMPLARGSVEALGWALLHFVWQGAAVAAILAALDLALMRARSAVRYAAACGALLLMLALPVSTFIAVRAGQPHPPHRMTSYALPFFRALENPAHAGESTALRPPARANGTASIAEGLNAGAGRALATRRIAFLIPWLVGVWGLGVLVLSVRLLGGWWLVARLGDARTQRPLEEWHERAIRLARALGVSRPVRLCGSALVRVPTAIGWLKPAILLPMETITGLRPAQIEAILAHELAHIRRHDYLVNLLQCVIETLLFYHPAVWWVSSRVREERELCCDDLAIQVLGDPVGYARALCELEESRSRAPELTLAASGGSLVARIARLLGTPLRRHDAAARGLAAAVGAASLIALGLAGLDVSAGKANPTARLAPGRAAVSMISAPVRAATAAVARAQELTRRAAVETKAIAMAAAAAAGVEASPEAPALASADPEAPAPAEETSGADPKAEAADTPREIAAIRRFTVDEWIRLNSHGIDERIVVAFGAAGYPDLSADQLIALVGHGVSPLYASNLRAAGLKGVAPDDLIQLANHGVMSRYVKGLHEAGLDAAGTEDLVRLASHGVTPQFVAGLRGIDPDDMSIDDLVQLADHGVSPEWFSAMQWVGLDGFTVQAAIQLHDAGVTPEYANRLKLSTRHHFTIEELTRLAQHGVDSRYAGRLSMLLGRALTVDEIVRMHDHGVGSAYVALAGGMGQDVETTDDLILLHDHGVPSDYASEMSAAGYPRLSAADLVRLHDHGVSPATAGQAREAVDRQISVDELIRLQESGSPACKEKK